MPASERPLVEAFYGISSPWAYLGAPRCHDIADSALFTASATPVPIH